jgi:lysophospholipase L1-like esterase
MGAYPFTVSKELGAVSFTNGYGATGIMTLGCAGVPRCIETFDVCYLNGQKVNYPKNPGAIVLNHGHNDGPSYSSEDFIREYKALLAKFTEKFPGVPVFCAVPFNQNRSEDILTAYNEYVSESGRDDIYFIATSDYYTDKATETTDGAHPTVETAQKFGKLLAKEIENILGRGYFDAE